MLGRSSGGLMENRYSHLMSALLLVLVTLVSTSLMRADVTGAILGVVRDKTQAVMGGAHIVATNVETNLSRDTTSASDGSCRVLGLPPGTCTVTPTVPGLRQVHHPDLDR